MCKKYKKSGKYLAVLLLTAAVLIQWGAPFGMASTEVKIIIDGNIMETVPQPFIYNNRTLVPLRVISEQLGAKVAWNEQDRTVRIVKGERSVLLRIDSRLIEYNMGEKIYNLSDVAPLIIESRTFVPLRLVSNALGVGINWEGSTKTVYIDSSISSDIVPFFDMEISSIRPGQLITGTTKLQVSFPAGVPADASQIRFLLLNPDNARGVVIAQGNNIAGEHVWLPNMQQVGQKILVAALYNANGEFISGTSIPVQVAVEPRVELTGIADGQVIKSSVTLKPNLNFAASYVKYEIINQNAGKVFTTREMDPQGSYTWVPMFEDNGNTTFMVTTYDHSGRPYHSRAVEAEVDVTKKLELKGISIGSTVEGPIILSVSCNFQINEIEYILRDPKTGNEEVLAKVQNSSYRWFPGPELTGTKELFVRVKDASNFIHTSETIAVKLTGVSKLLLEGIGPQQVVTGPVKLKATSNTALTSIQYVLINPQTGAKRAIEGGNDTKATYSWVPTRADEGKWEIQAEAVSASGDKITSTKIPFRVYLGPTYSAKPIIEKDKFLDLASGLAVQSWHKTGMSAALQTAQAILETGWGQSVPVDKYSGKFSYNLFGIKGTGPAGSVVSNTWEEYNGQTFRVDANFRAYNNINESWEDHKNLLLTASRYQPFREVMHDSTLGAWALRRAGYATDSQYPIKLINIIKTYNLDKLDEIGI